MKNRKIETSLFDILQHLVEYVESFRNFKEVKFFFIDSLYYSCFVNYNEYLMLCSFFDSITWDDASKVLYVKDTGTLVNYDYIVSYVNDWE